VKSESKGSMEFKARKEYLVNQESMVLRVVKEKKVFLVRLVRLES
jgi:hypothetical protein